MDIGTKLHHPKRPVLYINQSPEITIFFLTFCAFILQKSPFTNFTKKHEIKNENSHFLT